MTPEQENRMREIAQEVYNKNSHNEQFTALKIPKHVHNGADSPRISASNIPEFSALSDGATGVLGPLNNNTQGGAFTQNTSGNTVAFPIPLVYYGSGGGFNGGDAPDGTIVISTGGSYLLTKLWIRDSANNTWWRFDAGGHL